MKYRLLIAAILWLSAPGSASAQAGIWQENPALLSQPYVARAGPGYYYTEDIAIRPLQQQLRFNTSTSCFIEMKVRVLTPTPSAWQTIYNGGQCPVESPGWQGVPTAPGPYRIELAWAGSSGTWRYFTYDLLVAPNATRGFQDDLGNRILLWSGLDNSTLDRPFLLTEGINADNDIRPELYYVLSGGMFDRGRQRGMDVMVMNFANGGASIETNALAVERAIQYINTIKVGTRKLDLAGHSMGGVVSRFALASMESRGLTHNVGYYVSLDAPHQGAVLDHELQNWIAASDPSMVPRPSNLTSVAGKQLLEFNAFDLNSPTLHDQFWSVYTTINGDGYPHQTTENIGVSFGTSLPNASIGEEWLEANVPSHPNAHFYIEQGSVEAQGGSLLPLESSAIWGRALFGFAEYEFIRLKDPTFISYNSALDINNGVSGFSSPTINASDSRFHNQFPLEIVEPLLVRLGYPIPPIVATIWGPSSLSPGETGTWTVATNHPAGGISPYQLRWHYKLTCATPPPPPPCSGNICTESVPVVMSGPTDPDPCNVWLGGGTGRSFSRAGSYSYPSMTVRLRVTDAQPVTFFSSREVSFTSAMTGGGESAATGVGPAGSTSALSADGVPGVYALHPVAPNPSTGRTAVRFDLPQAASVVVVVLDVLGREVLRGRDGWTEAGRHEIALDGSALPSGVYVVRLQAGTFTATRTLTLSR